MFSMLHVEKSGRPDQSGDIIGCGCGSPPMQRVSIEARYGACRIVQCSLRGQVGGDSQP